MSEKTVILSVRGMHCEGCANNLGNTLRAVSGVREAYVNFGKKKVTIVYDAEQISQERLESAITDAGYEVE
jgi:copper chaperone CopZ